MMSILNLSFFAKDRNITKRTLFYFGFPLCLLFLGRTIFFFFYLPGYQAQYSFSQNTWALLYGLRFDFSVVFLVYGLFYWLVLLSPPHWQLRVLKLLVILKVYSFSLYNWQIFLILTRLVGMFLLKFFFFFLIF